MKIKIKIGRQDNADYFGVNVDDIIEDLKQALEPER